MDLINKEKNFISAVIYVRDCKERLQIFLPTLLDTLKNNFEKYEKEFKWKYSNEIATQIPIKSTVSKIKEMQKEGIDFELLNSKEIGIANITPSFMEKEEVVTASKKGTIMHLFLQKINFKEDYNLEKLENLREKLVYKKIISEEESKFINISKPLIKAY